MDWSEVIDFNRAFVDPQPVTVESWHYLSCGAPRHRVVLPNLNPRGGGDFFAIKQDQRMAKII